MPFNVQAKDWEVPPDPRRPPAPLKVAGWIRPPSSFLLHASDADAKRLFDLTGSVQMNALIMNVGY